jgi:hypothetical protein
MDGAILALGVLASPKTLKIYAGKPSETHALAECLQKYSPIAWRRRRASEGLCGKSDSTWPAGLIAIAEWRRRKPAARPDGPCRVRSSWTFPERDLAGQHRWSIDARGTEAIAP